MQVMALKVGHVTGWGWTCSSSAPQRLGVNALRAFVVSVSQSVTCCQSSRAGGVKHLVNRESQRLADISRRLIAALNDVEDVFTNEVRDRGLP